MAGWQIPRVFGFKSFGFCLFSKPIMLVIHKVVSRRLPILFNLIKPGQLKASKSTLSTVNHESRIKQVEEMRGDASLDPFSPIHEVQKPYLEELRPPLKRSFNLAAYVNTSKTLQKLITLGVSLYDIENTNKEAANYYVGLDFERDCEQHIKFLVDNGLKERNIGHFISEFPMIFSEHLDDLQARINYFESKGFSEQSIACALNRSSFILSLDTKTIDFKLGLLQIEFNLPAPILRKIIEKYPSVIALPEGQYKLVNFTLTEEFGFKTDEMHKLLLGQPQLMDILRPILIERLDMIHNKIGLSHSTIAKFPKLITGPRFDINNRYLYLKKLNRNQFNPREPLYVPPSALYSIDDGDFCTKYAKTNLDDYKLFLKSC